MLKIIREHDPVEVKRIVMMLYGQPGVGKTTLGFTADKPLTLDFDDGAHRSAFRKDCVQVSSWAEIANLPPEELAGYNTIVVDTGGRALDKLTAYLIQQDAKLGSKTGGLSLQGYGALKSAFQTWVRQLQVLGKDIVILAHDKEDKKGDNMIIRPDFQGGSYNEIVKVADCIGYVHQDGGKKLLDFSPTDSWIGKNCAGFASLEIPVFVEGADYLAKIIADTKAALNRQTEAQKQAAKELSGWQQKFDAATTAEDFNKLTDTLKSAPAKLKPSLQPLLKAAAKAKGLEYNKEAKGFAPIKKAEAQAPAAPTQAAA